MLLVVFGEVNIDAKQITYMDMKKCKLDNIKEKIIWILRFPYYELPWKRYALSECCFRDTIS